MPSNRPKIQILLTDTYYKKFKKLCNYYRRSESKMGELMIERYIEEFEKTNGVLTDKDNNEIKQAKFDYIKNKIQ